MNPGIMGIISPSVPITTKKIPKERYMILINLLFEGITFILWFAVLFVLYQSKVTWWVWIIFIIGSILAFLSGL